MPSLISAKPRGKFRPSRAEIPKRKVFYATKYGQLEVNHFGYGEKVYEDGGLLVPKGRIIGSMPSCKADDAHLAPVRSGIGVAMHLRRVALMVTCIKFYPNSKRKTVTKRLEQCAMWIKRKVTDAKPTLEGHQLRVIMWAEDAVRLNRENLDPTIKLEW